MVHKSLQGIGDCPTAGDLASGNPGPVAPDPRSRVGCASLPCPFREGWMRRREFIAGLGGAAAWPVVARGQTGKTHRIGFLSPLLASSPFVAAFREGLRELGYSEGQ